MKSKAQKILALSLSLILVLGAVLNVSAAKYVANVVADNSDYKNFSQPGDLNQDSKVNENDANLLKGLILSQDSNEYSDVNGDNETDICDLVLQSEAPAAFVNELTINLKGKSIYKGELGGLLTTGAKYKISFDKTGDIKIIITGLGEKIEVTDEYTFKTPLTISKDDVRLEIIGDGTIENLKIARINMDNDVAVG